MLFAVNNLASSKTFEVEPWGYKTKIPVEARESKDKFIKWCQKPTSESCHFTAAEGLDPLRRVAADNPAILLHGLIADYDAKVTPEMLKDLMANSPTEFAPNWGSQTFSNYGRLVWLFEEPVSLPNAALAKTFLKLVSRKLKLVKLLPGFDADAFFDPSKYYERGRNWMQLGGERIPKNFVHQWMYEAGSKVKWAADGLLIPMETVAAEVTKQYPGKWKGPFVDGARGTRFWDLEADNDTAAVVRASGMQCFTGPIGFVPWSVILGAEFVHKYEADIMGEIISNLFYDGRFYWRQDSLTQAWAPITREDFRLMLKVKYGLNSFTGKKETSSEIDRVMFAVQEQKSVVAAMPFVHFPAGTLFQNGVKYLNTSTVHCIQPSLDGGHEWGDGFPWLAEFLDGFFDPPEQKDYFLAWWKHFYANGLKLNPQSGQAVFIAGDPGIGKTLLSTAIVSRSVGGHVDASSYLLGEEKFTSHVVSSPVMSVDDTVPASDTRRHTRYSAMIKKIAANRYHTYEEKFQKAGQVVWLGRVMVTCNLDPESVKLLPNIELSLLDKVSLFKCSSVQRKFPVANELQKIIATELPHLCRYLLNWEIPKHCIGNSRFGVEKYHDKTLYNAALQTSASFSFLELLSDFLITYAHGANEGVTAWEGTATSLLADMSLDPRIGGIASKYSPNQMASFLGQLKARGYDLERVRSSTQRVWKIPFEIMETAEEEKKDEL